MKTLLDIDNDLMDQLLQTVGTRVKKEAVITAIKSYLESKKRDQLAELIGSYDFGYSGEDLKRMRENGKSRH